MLKIYQIRNYVSIDGADWRELNGYGHIVSDKDLQDTIMLDNVSFEDACEYLSKAPLRNVYLTNAFLTRKPIVNIFYMDAYDYVKYRRFKTISYKREVREWEDVTLSWMTKHLSAEQLLRYLKERGITACPMII